MGGKVKIMLIKIIVGILLIIVGLFVLAIVLVLNALKMKAKPRIEQIDLTPMPGVEVDFYLEYNQVLLSEGFEFLGDYSVATSSDKATKMRLFRNLSEGIEVSLYQQESENIRKIMISFETEFEDGFRIATSTHREPPLLILKEKRVYSLPDENFKELLKFHRQKLKEESEKRNVALDKMNESVADSIATSYRKELEEQLEYGILKFDLVNDTYSFTLYGAVRGILKMLAFSFTKGSNKTMFDAQYRVKNKKKERIKTINVMGFVFLMMGLFSLTKSADNSAVVYFRMFSILFGGVVVLITSYLLRTKEFKDSWK
jgi:hypothetical protein